VLLWPAVKAGDCLQAWKALQQTCNFITDMKIPNAREYILHNSINDHTVLQSSSGSASGSAHVEESKLLTTGPSMLHILFHPTAARSPSLLRQDLFMPRLPPFLGRFQRAR